MSRIVAGAFAVCLVIAGCTNAGNDSESDVAPTSVDDDRPPTATDFDRALPEGDEPEVLGPLGQTQVDVETDDGAVQIGAAAVPDVVDDAFPIPSDLQVQISSQEGDVAGFSGVSQLTFDDLVDFYETTLPAAGYEAELGRFVDGVVAVFDFSGRDGEGQVAISTAPGGGHSVLVTFTAS